MFETGDACVSPSQLLKEAKNADTIFQPLFRKYNSPFENKKEAESVEEERRKKLAELTALTKAPPKVYLREIEISTKQPSLIHLNKILNTKLRLKVNGFDNLAKRQVAISEGKYNKVLRYRKRLAQIEHKNQAQYRSTYRATISERELRYWWNIVLSPYFKENKRKAKVVYKISNCRSLRGGAGLMNCIGTIIPNNITIQYFAEYLQISNWAYSSNTEQDMEVIPMRWWGKQANFLEPLVLRFSTDMSGRKIGFEGLCPYCTVTREDRLDGYDKLFFNIRSCSYEAHVARKHGVYGSGEELSPPVFVQKENKAKFVCMECRRVNNMVSDPHDGHDDCLLEYFRHCVNCHYRRKNAKSLYTQLQKH